MPRSLAPAALALAAALALPAQAKTLVYCSEGSPENFTPALNTTGTSFDAARPVYDKLTQFKRGSTEVEPGLAESWTVSPDAKVFTFKLRQGVKFHSGVNGFKPTRDFNADDVLFSFERQWKDDHPYAKVSGGKYDYFADMGLKDDLEKLEKVDANTVRMTLKKPNVTMLANLAMDFASIHSAEYADMLAKAGKKEQLDQQPVGTGPFSFVTYQKDAVIRYKANPAYWGEKALVDDLVYAITPDPTARYSKLKAGECHFVIAPRPADLPEMQKDPALRVIHQSGLNIAYWAFNTLKPPFDKRDVRQALSMAIDKAAIIRDVYLGAGQAAKNLIPPTLWSYNDAVKDYPYDPAKAKDLLAKAGVKTERVIQWIDTPAALRALREVLRGELVVGLDVETTLDFKTLCLMQIATATRTYLVDPLAVGDLQPLADIFASERPTKIIHNARFERGVLASIGIELRGVYDTLEASRRLRGRELAGGHRLAVVCERELGVSMDKSAQTSNWGRRPLDAEQIRYAALDAEVLLQLYDCFAQMQPKQPSLF